MARKKSKRYRKRSLGVFYGVLAVLLIAVSVVGACVVFFRVEDVVVEGNSRYSTDQVLTAAAVEKGSNLILAPKELIIQRITESLTYMDEITIQKRFPTTLKLIVTESDPVAVLSSGGELWIINEKGKLLERADETLALQYIAVSGLELTEPKPGQPAQPVDGEQKQLAGLTGLLTALKEVGVADKVSEIDAGSPTEISMVYERRLKVKFLVNADFNRKIRVLEEIVAVLHEWEWGTLDLKTDRGFFTPG